MLVLITGASSGIGAALAKAYAAQGASLALLARRVEALETLRMSLPNASQHRIYSVDVCDTQALQRVSEQCIAAQGCPDIVIANAGVSVGTLTSEAEDQEVFEQVVRTNLLALPATFQPFINAMRARTTSHKGTLVGIASVAGIRGLPGSGAYSASKAATISYLESLRVELHQTGVRVVTIAPGFIRTPMTAINPYPMPFMLDADVFAARAVQAIARSKSFCVIPWQMGIVAKGLRLLPNFLYDRLFANAQHKPRKNANLVASSNGAHTTKS